MTPGPDAAGPPPGSPRARYKRPESVLVVVHTVALECLLLKRVAPPDFWQSVTGTLEWDESPAAAAARELAEETGLDTGGLVDAETSVRFPILPAWRERFAPGTESNLEHWFYLELPEIRPIRINADEHEAFAWVGHDEAIARVASWSNRAALEQLKDLRRGSNPVFEENGI